MITRYWVVWTEQHGAEPVLHHDELSAELARDELHSLAAYRGLDINIASLHVNTAALAKGSATVTSTQLLNAS